MNEQSQHQQECELATGERRRQEVTDRHSASRRPVQQELRLPDGAVTRHFRHIWLGKGGGTCCGPAAGNSLGALQQVAHST